MRDVETEKRDARVYLGVGLCQLNMCSGRIMMPRGGAPENEGRQHFKKKPPEPSTSLCFDSV